MLARVNRREPPLTLLLIASAAAGAFAAYEGAATVGTRPSSFASAPTVAAWFGQQEEEEADEAFAA